MMNSDGSNQTAITQDLANDLNPSWSPDDKIAFQSDRDGNFEIYSTDLDGMNPLNITNDLAMDIEPDWSPDGSKLVFTSSVCSPFAK